MVSKKYNHHLPLLSRQRADWFRGVQTGVYINVVISAMVTDRTNRSVNSRPRLTAVTAKQTLKTAAIFKREGNKKSLHKRRTAFVLSTLIQNCTTIG